ncbi:hypothetical protein ABW19_dt0202983 [Dactylella cylindrospora]|nr:hypothetical protein ABW19_dt0202983 [Dactylella cylindrospora]
MKQILFLILTLLSTGALAQLKPFVNYPNGLSDPFDPGYWSSTTAPQFTFAQWTNGKAPSSCITELANNGCQSGHAQVYNVTYTDCAQPWIFCRCDNAQMTLSAMIDLFGRMPVHLRSVVRHPMAVYRQEGGCTAYATINSWAGDIVMQGACYAPTVWIHETSHQLDFRGDPNWWGWHDSPEFQAGLAVDTCAADGYGNGDLTEEFAQIGVIAQYDVIRGFIPTQAYPGCLDGQLNALKTKFATSHLVPGGTCVSRVPNSPPEDAVWFSGRIKRQANETTHTECSFGEMWVPPEYADLV